MQKCITNFVDMSLVIRRTSLIAPLALFILLVTYSVSVQSQSECGSSSLEEALKLYNNGNFQKVKDILIPCVPDGFNEGQMVQAYRLLAMTYLALDEYDLAVEAANDLLELDPDFSPTVFDPLQFVRLINQQRHPVTRLVTASKQAEPIQEVPVPVTVITADMIKDIGARTLKDALLIYVPGMTDVTDHNEMNISMHGVYASSQQKILIMLNGHRLNSRAYSMANPDFSISLDKVKQIEVLRGPASSLYGNVALTSVINIITKTGKDIQGADIKLGLGNYGQKQLSLLFGNPLGKSSGIVFWGNYYQADGQEVYIPKHEDYSPNPKEGYAIIGGFKDRPAYDVGVVFRSKHVSLLGNLRYCKQIDPFTAGGITGEVYDYKAYRTLMGVGPGLGSGFGHLDLKYEKTFNRNEILINPYFDFNTVNADLVINPNEEQFGMVAWNEYSSGAIMQYKRSYAMNGMGRGNVIAGAQVDYMKVYDSFFLLGKHGEFTNMGDSSGAKILDPGSESIFSGFLQIKHRLAEKIILNLGARYDHKIRHRGNNVNNLSPRLSLIYIPQEKINIKLSYAQSFVDAPYWYRYNALASYKGAENLLPEYLSAVQLTTNLYFFEKRLNYELNAFYNSLKDFIYRDPKASGDEPRYCNAGELKLTGLESSLKYRQAAFHMQAVVTWMYAIDAKDYPVSKHEIHNIPAVNGSLVLNFNPLHKLQANTWLNLTLRYIGKQLSPINTFKNGETYQIVDNYVENALIVHAGIRIADLKNFSASFNVNNLLNKAYWQGGSVEFPYPQAGRWYLFQVGYKIQP